MTRSVSVISPALAEQAEAEAYADFEAAATDAGKTALGMRQLRIGGGVALAMRNDPSGFWSKTLGLGFAEPVTAGLVERVIEFYRDCGLSSATLQFAPQVLPTDWADITARLTISGSGSALVKLAGDLGTVTAGSRDVARSGCLDDGLHVTRVPAARAREWAEVTLRVFGLLVEHQVEMGTGCVGRPGWQAFAVFSGSEIVATAGLYVTGSVGHLFGAATLPGARRRGAQSALIAARAAAAREAGCAWLVGETFAEGPGQHNSSLHNMLRAGMSVCYKRPNWTWRDGVLTSH
jgi:GNAT superfamily N-acetyltransferase